MDEEENVGTDSAATLVGRDTEVPADPDMDEDKEKTRTQWDNKIQYLLAQIGFAVGLGNVWRFPYLCQKNGGGAFLIPYFIMMIIEGIPLFYLEIAIGQRLRRGSVGVWNHIHPYLGGVGIASMVVCFFIALYYNVIIAWASLYFLNSFRNLPWESCPVVEDDLGNFTEVQECAISSPTSYFWYRNTLNISPSIEEPGAPEWKLVLCLLLAWAIVFAGTFKGIKSSGKAVYFSATFPYLVLLIFFFRAISLDGAVGGLAYMVTPDYEKLKDPNVWRDAATQIFFSLGLGFGGVIAYSSYNDFKNNCRKDALTVSLINSATSIFASVVVFSVLGFKAHAMNKECNERNIEHIHSFFNERDDAADLKHVLNLLNADNYYEIIEYVNNTMHLNNQSPMLNEWIEHTNTSLTDFKSCSISSELDKAVSGPGLAFIAFTEAMTKMPGGPFWSVLFFSMLINLGLGSMFGTMEGIITPLKDLGLKLRKEICVAIICFVSFAVGLIFCLRSGMYVVNLFDSYAGTLPLLLIAFFENIAVVYVYGMERFSKDLDDMMGNGPPGWFWKVTWYAVSPICMAVLFISSVVSLGLNTPTYGSYDDETGLSVDTEYPWWGVAVIVLLILCSIIWIPLVAFLRWSGVLPYMAPDSASKKNKLSSRNESPFV